MTTEELILLRKLLMLAAKAAGYDKTMEGVGRSDKSGTWAEFIKRTYWESGRESRVYWNPINDEGDLYLLARKVGINIDFSDCCAWKRLPNGDLIQEFWGGDHGSEAQAIVRAAAEVGKGMLSHDEFVRMFPGRFENP